jgi:hypothetical protein
MASGSWDEAVAGRRTMSSPPPGEPSSANDSATGMSSTSVYPLSSWRVRRFVPALRRISRELDLPEPTRARILLELASDLEGLVNHYRARGLGEEEAAQRAEAMLLIPPDALQQLIRVHTTGYQRWVSRAAGRLRWGFDLLLFVVGVLPMLLMAVIVIVAQLPAMGAVPLFWPLVAGALAVVTVAGVKAYELFVRRERSTRRLHRGLPALVFLGVLGPVLGMIAGLTGLYRLAMALGSSALAGPALHAVNEQAGRDATLLVLGLLLAFCAGVVWFVLVNRIASIELAESAALLGTE